MHLTGHRRHEPVAQAILGGDDVCGERSQGGVLEDGAGPGPPGR
jgi:hypothetical protein